MARVPAPTQPRRADRQTRKPRARGTQARDAPRRRRASSTRLRRQSETFARRRFSRRENTKRRRRGAESRGSRPRRRPRRSLPRRRPGREPIDPFHASPNRDRGEGTAGLTLAIRLAFGLGSHRSGNRRAELHSGGASRGDNPVRRVGGLERAVEEERWADAATLRDALRDMNARSVDHRSVFRGDETDDDPGIRTFRNEPRDESRKRNSSARTREEAELSLSSLFSTCRPLPGMYHVVSKVTGDTWNRKIVRSPSTSGRCCRDAEGRRVVGRRESAYERFPDPSTTTSTSI